MASVENFAGDEWRGRVGGAWAAEWVRTDRSFGQLTAKLVDALAVALSPAGDATPRRVLDIGCGAGEAALRLADAHPELRVTGLDLSAELIAVARTRGAGVVNLSFELGDAGVWQGEEPFEGALSRHGVMFFDDPVASFSHLHGLMVPGAPFVFTCFSARADNLWASGLAELLDMPPPVDPYAPGPFAFADAERVHEILRSSGWTNATSERVDYPYIPGGGEDPVADAFDFFMRIGPAARHIATLEASAREAITPRLKSWLERHIEQGEVRFPAAAWLWRATA
jgi:SAM-dependent methyltransferase